jgi:hypothetical protein
MTSEREMKREDREVSKEGREVVDIAKVCVCS